MFFFNLKPSPAVSVILAAYNHRDFIAEAVESVLDQSLADLELIVVDDGSDDGTPDVVETIRDRRLHLIRLPENRLAHPRMVGLARARGRYVAFQNSDDIWHEDKLRDQVAWMKRHAGYAACFTGVALIDGLGNSPGPSWASHLFTTQNRSRHQWLRHFFEVGNCLCLPSALVRRDAVLKIGGFRQSLVQLSDFDLWVRLAALGELHILEAPLTSMRIVEGKNLSRPSPAAARRGAVEHEEVLLRYVEAEIVQQAVKIFPDLAIPERHFPACVQAALALHAIDVGSVPHHRFADRVLARLVDDPASRHAVTRAYGADIVKRFISHRATLQTTLVDEA